MTLTTGQRPACHPPRVDGVAFERESARKKPLLLLRTRDWVAKQVNVFRDPKDLFRRKAFPAVGACHPGRSFCGVSGGCTPITGFECARHRNHRDQSNDPDTGRTLRTKTRHGHHTKTRLSHALSTRPICQVYQ